jgi:hypothetical protein
MPSGERIAQSHDFARECCFLLRSAARSCAIDVHRTRVILVRRSWISHQNGMTTVPILPRRSSRSRVKSSFRASLRDDVFGKEDGTVSIFGLVFGVAEAPTAASCWLPA